MADPDDEHYELHVADFVEDPVVPHPNPPDAFVWTPGEQRRPARPGIDREAIDCAASSASRGFREAGELAPGAGVEPDLVPIVGHP